MQDVCTHTRVVHYTTASSPMVDDLTDKTYKPILDHESDNKENSEDEVDG